MHDKIVSIVRAELNKIDATSMAARQGVYERVRNTIARLNGGSTLNPQSVEISLALETAIEQIENQYAPNTGTFVERAIHRTISAFAVLKSKYGAFSVVVTSLSDFIKPIIDTSQPIIFISAGAGAVFLVLQKFAGSFRGTMRAGATFFCFMFVCSLGWWGLQKVIPGANASGAIAAIVPGATAIQNAVLASLGRIEQQTKRVGDLLEDGARQEQKRRDDAKQESDRARAEAERKQREELDGIRQRVIGAGFSVDAKGLLAAVAAGYRNIDDFTRLGINPTEQALVETLAALDSPAEIIRTWDYLNSRGHDHAFIRTVSQSIAAVRQSLREIAAKPGARAKLCLPDTYTPLIGRRWLERACATDGVAFAIKYSEYARETYAVETTSNLTIQATTSSPALRLAGQHSLGRLPQRCTVYDVNTNFSVLLNPMPQMSNGAPSISAYDNGDFAARLAVDIIDPAYRDMSFQQRCRAEPAVRACRVRVVVASPCEGANVRIVKFVSFDGASADSATPSPQGPAALPATPAAGPAPGSQKAELTAEEVRRLLITKDVDHAGRLQLFYKLDGTFDAGDGRLGSTGRYRIEPDGRVCWDNSRGASGCFQYYRKGLAIHVRRNDPSSRDEIGQVKITAR